MTENKNIEVIDLREAARKLWGRRKLFCKVLPIVFVLSCAYILCIPRSYTSSLSLAPETGGSSGMGALGSLASNFGIDLGGMETGDAISPLLYPDLMDDNGFVVSLFSIGVESGDGELKCSYYDYLRKHQKRAFWEKPMGALKRLLSPKPKQVVGAGEQDPYILSKEQDEQAEKIRKNIVIGMNKKTGVISINTKAQDALICKTLADSVREHLQVYITQYRTNKARIDMEYYKQLSDEAKADFEQARRLYSSFADSHTEINLPSYQAKLEDLGNDMQLKYNTYTSVQTQYLAARAKVQERTPAFTVVKGASVPIKPSKPKRMLFVIGMCFLACFFLSFWIVRKDLHFMF